MIPATQIRKGMIILKNNDLYRVTAIMHVTQGRGAGFIQVKMKRLSDGISTEERFNSNDRVERGSLNYKKMEFLYHEGTSYFFMDQESYEQFELNEDLIGDSKDYLLPNHVLNVEFHDGNVVGIELPKTVELKVEYTEPILKGATQSAQYKPAKLETGVTINVPQFIKIGDVVRVDTTTGEYIERAK